MALKLNGTWLPKTMQSFFNLPLPRRRLFMFAGIRLVALLRKVQKPSKTTSESISSDDDLCSMV